MFRHYLPKTSTKYKGYALDMQGYPPLEPRSSARPPSKAKEKEETYFFELFKFASFMERFMIFIGCMFAFINGLARGLFFLVISLSISSFDARYTKTDFEAMILPYTLNFIYIAIAIFLGVVGSRTLLKIGAQRQGYKFNQAYFKALLQHDIHFYDKITPHEFISQLDSDCKTIVNALDTHLEAIVSMAGTIIVAFIISLLRSWHIALMMVVVTPFVIGAKFIFRKSTIKASTERFLAYTKAGAIAEEALTNIKTIVRQRDEKAELKKYTEAIQSSQKNLVKTRVFQGLAFGSIEVFFLFCLGIISYFGSHFIEDGAINPLTKEPYIITDIITPLYAMFQAISMFPIISENLKGVTAAKAKVRKILDIIDQVKIPATSYIKIVNFTGAITFENVSFAYPTNPNKLVLRNLNFQIEPNTKVAIVGEPGSGKTTITQLLQNFYNLEDEESCIKFDNLDMNSLDVPWLRKNIAYLGKEPVLFSMTIRENLLLGKKDATEDELIQALKKAGAYDFVMNMENKLDTIIGEGKSTQLSMEQKQRIVIARALLKDAKVLILDEATSALDSTSEKEILKTLNNLPGERTVIIIAQWLSAIKKVDQIIVLNEGQIDEIGTHEELMKKEGKYKRLQAMQANRPVSPLRSEGSEDIEKQRNKFLVIEEEEGEDESEEDIALMKQPATQSEQKEPSQQKKFSTDMKRLWDLAKSGKKYFILAVFSSLGHALLNPFNNLVIAWTFSTLISPVDSEFREDINVFCSIFAGTGIVIFMCFAIEFWLYTKASESLTQVLRREVFYKFLRMNSEWYDQPENKLVNLTASLENDTASAGQIVGPSLGIIIQIIFSCMLTIIVSLLLAWRPAIIGIFTSPLVVYVAFKLSSNERKSKEERTSLLLKAEALVLETINNMKILISFDAREIFFKEYSLIIEQYQRLKLKTQLANCLLEGGLFLVLYVDFAAIYYYEAYLFLNEGFELYKLLFVIISLVFTALGSTQLFSLIPDTVKTVDSAHQMLHYLDMQSKPETEEKKDSSGEIP